MEVCSEPQHRMRMNLCAGRSDWVNVPRHVTPDIQTSQAGTGGGDGGKICELTLGDLRASVLGGRPAGNGRLTRPEKSDHLIVAMKPGNSGGAKGVTS